MPLVSPLQRSFASKCLQTLHSINHLLQNAFNLSTSAFICFKMPTRAPLHHSFSLFIRSIQLMLLPPCMLHICRFLERMNHWTAGICTMWLPLLTVLQFSWSPDCAHSIRRGFKCVNHWHHILPYAELCKEVFSHWSILSIFNFHLPVCDSLLLHVSVLVRRMLKITSSSRQCWGNKRKK